jgi:hypothetical protein
MERSRGLSRRRRQEINHEARAIYARARTRGMTVDEIQEELRASFGGELAPGEARMYAHGWHATFVREGIQAIAFADGADLSGLQDADVLRWLRNEVYPRDSLDRLCRLFQCHQAQLGWPPPGNDLPIDYRTEPAGALETPNERVFAGTQSARVFLRVQSVTTKLLQALLMSLAFPKPWTQTDLRVYCHRAAQSVLFPVAWAGAHREGDVHDPIPYGSLEAVRSFAIAEACASGRFVVRDNIERSELENSLNIPLYVCVLAAPIRQRSRSVGTISLGSFRPSREARLDRPEGRDLLMTFADGVSELWEGLDEAFDAYVAERSATALFTAGADLR